MVSVPFLDRYQSGRLDYLVVTCCEEGKNYRGQLWLCDYRSIFRGPNTYMPEHVSGTGQDGLTNKGT